MSKTATIGFHDVKSIILRQTGEDNRGNPWGDLVVIDHAGNEDKVNLFWPKGTMPMLGWSGPVPAAAPPALMPDQVDMLVEPPPMADPIAVKLDKIIARAGDDAEIPF